MVFHDTIPNKTHRNENPCDPILELLFFSFLTCSLPLSPWNRHPTFFFARLRNKKWPSPFYFNFIWLISPSPIKIRCFWAFRFGALAEAQICQHRLASTSWVAMSALCLGLGFSKISCHSISSRPCRILFFWLAKSWKLCVIPPCASYCTVLYSTVEQTLYCRWTIKFATFAFYASCYKLARTNTVQADRIK